MSREQFLIGSLAIGLLFLGMSLQAAPIPEEATVEGTVIRAGDAKLTLMSNSDNSIHKFAVASDADIKRDGRNVKLEDIHFGDYALVSVMKDKEVPIATVIVALSPLHGDG